MQTLAFAPGKLFLFGEHAVVQGHPAIAFATDTGVWAKSCFSKKAGVCVLPRPSEHVLAATKEFLKADGIRNMPRDGITIRTKTNIPFPGMGSSSASIVATLRSLNILFGKKLSNKRIFSLACRAKKRVEGGVGSFVDLASASFGGGMIYYCDKDEIKMIRPKNLGQISFTAANTPRILSTREMIRRVGAVTKTTEGHVLIDGIRDITNRARTSIVRGDWQEVGRLMLDNHALLSFLGANNPALSKIVRDSMQVTGVLGAKTSGAGGGDCAIILSKKSTRTKKIADRVKTQEGIKVAGVNVLLEL